MAAVGFLWIEEYNGMYASEGFAQPIPSEMTAEQKVTIDDTTSAASAAFRNDTQFIKVSNQASATGTNYQIAAAPTASNSTRWLPDNAVEFIKVSGGDKIAVLEAD